MPAEVRKAEAAGLDIAGRVYALEESFAAAGVDVVGIQEGRIPGPHMRTGHRFWRYAGTCCKGHLGVQLWFNQASLPAVKVRYEDVGDRLGLAWVTGLQQRTCFLVAHSPHQAAATEELDRFYEQLEQTTSKVRKAGWRLIGMGDMNARVGSVASEALAYC